MSELISETCQFWGVKFCRFPVLLLPSRHDDVYPGGFVCQSVSPSIRADLSQSLCLVDEQMVECDRARNSNREALTALRRQARTSRSSLPAPQRPKHALISVVGEPTPPVEEACLTCGAHDGSSPMWVMCRSADVFVRLPFHTTHSYLEKGTLAFLPWSQSLNGVSLLLTLNAFIPPNFLESAGGEVRGFLIHLPMEIDSKILGEVLILRVLGLETLP